MDLGTDVTALRDEVAALRAEVATLRNRMVGLVRTQAVDELVVAGLFQLLRSDCANDEEMFRRLRGFADTPDLQPAMRDGYLARLGQLQSLPNPSPQLPAAIPLMRH